MNIPLPTHFASCTDNDIEAAFAASQDHDRATIKTCLALLHRLYTEAPSVQTHSMTWPESGFQLTHTQKPVPWVVIHCPNAVCPTHLAATVMIARLANVEHCLVLFDTKSIPHPLLTSLALCGIVSENILYPLDTQTTDSTEPLSSLAQHGQGRLVLLGNTEATPKNLMETALHLAVPILHAADTKNFTPDLTPHATPHATSGENHPCIKLCPNLTPALFTENTLHAKHIPDNTDIS